jgi:hypothetical protein
MRSTTHKHLSLFSLLLFLLSATFFAVAHGAPTNTTDVEDVDPPTVGDPGPAVDDKADGPIKVIDDEDGEEVDLPELPELDLDTVTDNKKTATAKVNATVLDVMVRVGLNATEIAEDKDEIDKELAETLGDFFDDGDEAAKKRDLAEVEERDELEARDKDKRRRRRCRILAGLLRGFVRLAARRFDKKNDGPGIKPKYEHMFFLYPLHRPLFDAGIDTRVWFKAKWVVARFWTNTAGVTFGKRIYIRGSLVSFNAKGTTAQQNAFFDQARLLAHEFEHVQQYRAYGFSIKKFAYDYLYRWCRAGKNYDKNPMEKSAEAAATKLHPLLYTDRSFFKLWIRDKLRTVLGYPVETGFRDAGGNLRLLKFQKGEMEVNTKTGCYRKKVGSWGPWIC